jgi:multidrug efflux pump
MQGDNLPDLIAYSPKMLEKLKAIHSHRRCEQRPAESGLQAMVTYDRATAARFNIAPQLIDDTLYDAFGQRQVSTMYTSLNQYHVVMEAAPQFWQILSFCARSM